MRCFCRVEYDGTQYSGWQVQNKDRSVQSTLEEAFSTVTRIPCKIVGAGRTDAGVHARGQGLHIDLPQSADLGQCETSVNAVLPNDIGIYNLQKVSDDFHARYSAKQRCYKYRIATRKMPLFKSRAYKLTYTIDWNCLRKNCTFLIGTHDFTAFCAAGSSAKSMLCTVEKAELTQENDLYVFTIVADRFLYKMVRSIVGTLIDISRGNISMTLDEIIQSKKRALVGQTAPAHGLVLDYVTYDEVL